MKDDMVEIQKEKYEDGCCSPSDEPHYPYGTSLNLRDELISELNIGGLKVGDTVEIRSKAIVTSTSERQDEDTEGATSEKSVGLQLTRISVSRQDDDRIDQLYGQ